MQVGTSADEEKGFGLPRRSEGAANGLVTCVDDGKGPKATTLWECFLRGKAFDPNAKFLGTRKYKVADTPAAPAAAAPEPASPAEGEEKKTGEKKKKKPSGYVERGDGSIMRYEYVHESYAEVESNALAIGRALVNLGMKAGQNVGIYSVNRAEWITCSLGFYSQNLRTVSLYATLGPDAVEYIINHAETPIVIVSKENLPSLKRVIPKIKDTVKHVIVFDTILNGRYGNTLDKVQDDDVEAFNTAGIKLHGLQSIIDMGNTLQTPTTLPSPDDLAFIMYTSGTTGVPKGAQLTHGNIMAVAGAVKYIFNLNQGDMYFSYLPLAHIFETAVQAYVWSMGGVVNFSQGDIRQLIDDLTNTEPHLFCGVPRVFVKFYQNVWATVEKAPCIKKWYITKAYNYQCAQLAAGLPLDASYDNKVFSVMRKKMGLGRVRALITGAAPCPPYLIEFMKIVTNAYFAQGYGMTESSAGNAVVLSGDNLCGHVGPPLACNYIRLADIPDMNYTSADEHPRGEILIHGPNVFKGYYKNQEATDDVLFTDSKGRVWLRTGDVGRWNPNGTLSIIDRKKNMIKLAQGEYVAVEKVEDVYGRAPCISQIWCYGNSYKSFMVGVVVINAQPLYEFAISNNIIPSTTPAPVAGNLNEAFLNTYSQIITGRHAAQVKAWVKAQLSQVEGSLLGFEKMKDFYIEPVVDSLGLGFNEENDCMTPTMKKKRKPLTEKYIDQLKKMYSDNGEKPADGEKW